MKKNIIFGLVYFMLINSSCKSKTSYDEESVWLLQNEKSINKELERRITEELLEKNTDNSWVEKSIVVTKYDTSILGTFAKRIAKLSDCLNIEYTFSKNLNDRKTITILNDTSNNCKSIIRSPFLMIDSTEYFKVIHSQPGLEIY